jgi:hypothetical protein
MAVAETPIPLQRRSRPTRAPAAAPHLVHPRLDTWLVGGLSLVTLAVIAALSPLRSSVSSVDFQLKNLVTIAPTLALFVNYPHFLASYRLAYWRRDAVPRHLFALLFVPVALTIAVLLAYLTYDARVAIGGHVVERFGSRLSGWLIALMFLTVGWHYVKQAYGCARVGARVRGFALPGGHARLLRYSLFPLWVAIWVRANVGHGSFDYSGVHYGAVGFPSWSVLATNIAIVAGVVTAAAVAGSLWRTNRRVPPLLMVVPVVAMFAWWIPATYNPTFFVLVPMVHSLQYLPFAAKVERGRTAARHPERRALGRRLAVVAVVVGLAGWVAFEIGPNVADSLAGTSHRVGLLFFTAMIPVGINIHHYFIDHVIWRAGEPEVFTHLTAAPAPTA